MALPPMPEVHRVSVRFPLCPCVLRMHVEAEGAPIDSQTRTLINSINADSSFDDVGRVVKWWKSSWPRRLGREGDCLRGRRICDGARTSAGFAASRRGGCDA